MDERDFNAAIREKVDRRRNPQRYRQQEPLAEDPSPIVPSGDADAGKGASAGDPGPSLNDLIRREAGLSSRFGR